jgi:hypothetical protein
MYVCLSVRIYQCVVVSVSWLINPESLVLGVIGIQQDLLYDLSMVGVVAPTSCEAEVGANAKDGNKPTRLNQEEFVTLRATMKASDETREKVIVGGRTVQKLSKVAIFSCHRNKLDASKSDLEKVCTINCHLA